jgi:hypothetical protein
VAEQLPVPRLLLKALKVAGDGRIWLPVPISLLLLSASPANASVSISPLLANMIDHGCIGGNILVPNVDARSLATVIKYCNKHATAAKPSSGSHHGAVDDSDSDISVFISLHQHQDVVSFILIQLLCSVSYIQFQCSQTMIRLL